MKILDHPYLFQWDTSRKLEVNETGAMYVDFARKQGTPIRIAVVDGIVKIPDSWLQCAGEQVFYICYENGTLEKYIVMVSGRQKPTDYASEPDEALNYKNIADQFQADLLRIEAKIDAIAPIVVTEQEYLDLVESGQYEPERIYLIKQEDTA
nr:MAG TPA: hypothetical protein [Caudoviricetes sp.]